jgi:fatty acid desaturase
MSTHRPIDFPPLAEVRQNFRVRWYRSPVDPARLRELMRRSDLQGALQTFGHLGLFAVAGAAAAYFFTQGRWLPFALALWCQGTVGTFFRGLATHELGHGTVFRTKWLNAFFLRVLSLLSFWNHHEYAMSHTYHHRYTLHPDGDREVLLPRDLGLRVWTLLQLLTVNLEGFAKLLRETFRMALPRYNLAGTERGGTEWTESLFSLAPDVRRKSVRWARLTVLFHAAIFAVAAVFDMWWLAIVLTGYLFVGNWLTFLVGAPMHIGLRDNVPDFRLCVRSNKLNPFISFLYWRMNWHTEHHMFAGVPCYNLKKLAREIQADMPVLRSLGASWREMIAAERRRKQEPTYQFNTPLPPSAHAAVEHVAEVQLPGDEQVQLEASIGELAPTGQ